MKQTYGKFAAGAIALAGFAIAVAPLERHGELPIPLHHVFHAAAVAGGVALALLLMRKARDSEEHGLWLVPATLAPLAMMLLMWPSFYASLDGNPVLHVADHLALFFSGYVTAVAGQRYRAGTGWALGTLSVIMALTAAGGFGSYT